MDTRRLASPVPHTRLSSGSYRNGEVAIFVVWDEDGPMPFMSVAPSIPAVTVITTTIDHLSLLRTTEDLLGLERLGGAATATSLVSRLHLDR